MQWNNGIEYCIKETPYKIQSEIQNNLIDHLQGKQEITLLRESSIRSVFRTVHNHLHRPGRVIEFGSFQMYGLVPFMKAGYHCTAVDIFPDVLSSDYFIKTDHPRLKRVVAMMEDPPLNIKYDAVILNATLHHTDKLDIVCNNFYNLLDDKGILIVANEPYLSLIDRDNKEMTDNINKGHNDNFYKLKDYIRALKKAGFHVKVKPIKNYYKNLSDVATDKTYKKIGASIIRNILKTRFGYWMFDKTFPLTCRITSLPLILEGRK